MLDLIKANAKAIAVPIAALLVWFVKWVSVNAGAEIVVDNAAVVNGIAVAIIAIAVWWTRNRAKPTPQ